MKRSLICSLLLLAAASIVSRAADPPPSRLYQLRAYTTPPGKLPVLLARFQAHNLAIFERCGVKLEGAWTPLDPKAGETLYYLVSFADRAAADKAWAAFNADPEWKDCFAKEKAEHGTVVASVKASFLDPADFSPALPQAAASGPPRLFELRTYHASPGKMANLDARFRDHTLALFGKHGMTNVLYTHPAPGEADHGESLVYLLAFPDKAKADASWAAFHDDPDWQKVSAASQPDGVKLAAKVESIFLVPTSFSPLK